MEPKEHFKLLSVSIEGLESELKYAMTRRKVEEELANVVDRYLFDNISCASERDSNIFSVYFNLEDLRELIKSQMVDLFPEAEKDSIHVILDPT